MQGRASTPVIHSPDLTMPNQTPSEYQFSEQIGHLLRRAYQRHTSIFRETIVDAQLTAAQFVVLCAVREKSACEVRDLVSATALDEPTVRGIIERLKWRELLDVAHEPGDTRHMVMTLTPTGRMLVEQIVPVAEQISELTFGTLSKSERSTLVTLLRRISGIDGAA